MTLCIERICTGYCHEINIRLFSLFSPLQCHQDTEKANGIFGTLVIQLPSDYSGGQLVISHDGNNKIFDFSGMKGCTNFHYAAFYADCQHELTKVTKGYRLCLIYNLIYSGTGSLPVPMKSSLVIGQLSQAMQLWNDEASQHKGPPMMAYILKNKYCEASLSFKDLKNADRGVGDVLAKACLEVNFDFYLAHVIRREMWWASCYRKKYTLTELNDDSIDASHFISPQGQKPAYFSNVSLDDGAMVPKERYKLDKPDAEQCSEATGNEGASVERWYKWTALILWPLKKRLVNIGSDKVAGMLKMPTIWNPTLLTEAEKENNLKFAGELVESDGHSASSAIMLLQCLRDLGQTELIHKFLSGDISEFLQNADFRKVAFNLCDSCVGWVVISPSLWALMNDNRYFTTCCGPLTDLVAISLKNPSAAELKSLCVELATAFVKAASSKGKYDSHNEDVGISMLKVLLNLGDAALVSKFLLFLANASYEHYANISIFLRSQLFVEQLVAIGKAFAWETLEIGLMILFKDIAPANISKYCDFLCRLVCSDNLTPQKQLVCRNLMDIIIDIVIMEQDFDPRALGHHHCGTSLDFKQDEEHRAANSIRSPDFVYSVLTILIALDYNKVKTESVINAFARQPNRYPVGFVVLPALEYLRLCQIHDFNNTTFISIVTRFISVVQGWINPSDPCASNPNVSPPISWSRNVTIECYDGGSCDDCKKLEGFLRDPVSNLVHFRINQRRRSHLEKELNFLKCGTKHFTDPRGSPQTLVIFKLGHQFQGRNQLTHDDLGTSSCPFPSQPGWSSRGSHTAV